MSDIESTRMEAHIGRLHTANARERAVDAAAHLRQAIDILEPVQRSPALDRVASLLDEAATLLLEATDT